MIQDLSTQYVSSSYKNLLQVSGSGELFDGLANPVYSLYINIEGESSTSVTSSYSFVAQTSTSSSFATTSSFSQNSRTSSFALNTNTLGSNHYSTYAITGSNVFQGDQQISGSLKVKENATFQSQSLGGIINTICAEFYDIDADFVVFDLPLIEHNQVSFAFNYSVINKDDSRNIRRGTIFAVSDVARSGNQLIYEDKVDIELGDTSDIVFVFQTDFATKHELLMGFATTTLVPLWDLRISCNTI